MARSERIRGAAGNAKRGRSLDKRAESVEIRSASKAYGAVRALDDVSLNVAPANSSRCSGLPAPARPRCSAFSAASSGPTGTILFGDRDVTLDAAAQARHRRRVPELRAVPAYERRRERRLSAARAAAAASRLAGESAQRRWRWSARRLRRARHRAALRRPAPARGARARDDLRAAPDPDGRAALRARQAAARIHADRAARAAQAHRRHHHLRHARPARGADHERPRRRSERRPR